MHPIERLRYVARAGGVEQATLVRETASALSAFGDDSIGLVTACRRIIDRHPTSGPLWWLCARVLVGEHPRDEAWNALEEIEDDRTGGALGYSLPDDSVVCVIGWPEIAGEALVKRGDATVLAVDVGGEATGLVQRLYRADSEAVDITPDRMAGAVASSTLVVVESDAVGPTHALAVAGSLPAVLLAREAGVPVWLVAGVGRLLPARMWEGMLARRDPGGDDLWEFDEDIIPLDFVDAIVGPKGPQSPDIAIRRTDCPVAVELFKDVGNQGGSW
ncbi:MAG TPA: hypothetical protein VMW08_01230 [Acidimicrobiales bacterium]|nr:hypothetical protein [Acidimicrobiales bacterium]